MPAARAARRRRRSDSCSGIGALKHEFDAPMSERDDVGLRCAGHTRRRGGTGSRAADIEVTPADPMPSMMWWLPATSASAFGILIAFAQTPPAPLVGRGAGVPFLAAVCPGRAASSRYRRSPGIAVPRAFADSRSLGRRATVQRRLTDPGCVARGAEAAASGPIGYVSAATSATPTHLSAGETSRALPRPARAAPPAAVLTNVVRLRQMIDSSLPLPLGLSAHPCV